MGIILPYVKMFQRYPFKNCIGTRIDNYMTRKEQRVHIQNHA